MSAEFDLQAWLREFCAAYTFDVAGVYLRGGEHPWPLTAGNALDLESQLAAGGHLLPLPKEPAALANIIEVSIVDFILRDSAEVVGLEATRGTERGYPDIEFTGAQLSGGFEAVDVKVARRHETRPRYTQSRITLYTGNTYFRFPKLRWPGTFRPFDSYRRHLDVIVIYTFSPDVSSRVSALELIVQEPWRIGSKQRSSTTREYLGAVDLVQSLRDGKGEFSSQEEFYKFWRSYPFKLSAQVQKQLQRLVDQQEAQLKVYRSNEDPIDPR